MADGARDEFKCVASFYAASHSAALRGGSALNPGRTMRNYSDLKAIKTLPTADVIGIITGRV